MADRRRRTAEFFSGVTVNSKDFDALVGTFQALLESGLNDNAEWWLHARMWRLYLLADIRGYWCGSTQEKPFEASSRRVPCAAADGTTVMLLLRREPTDGVAMALQAVSGVPPQAAQQVSVVPFLPWKKWVYDHSATMAAAAEAARQAPPPVRASGEEEEGEAAKKHHHHHGHSDAPPKKKVVVVRKKKAAGERSPSPGKQRPAPPAAAAQPEEGDEGGEGGSRAGGGAGPVAESAIGSGYLAEGDPHHLAAEGPAAEGRDLAQACVATGPSAEALLETIPRDAHKARLAPTVAHDPPSVDIFTLNTALELTRNPRGRAPSARAHRRSRRRRMGASPPRACGRRCSCARFSATRTTTSSSRSPRRWRTRG